MLVERLQALYLADRDQERVTHSTNGSIPMVHASSMGQCQRAQVLRSMGAKAEFSPTTLLLFRMGHVIHGMVQADIARLPDVTVLGIEQEASCPAYGYRGRCDMIITIDGRRYIVEIKSVIAGKVRHHPIGEHVNQLFLYMRALDIHDGLILYTCKDTGELFEYLVHYDPLFTELLLKRVEAVSEWMRRKELPPREGKPDDPMCQRCEYRKTCDVL